MARKQRPRGSVRLRGSSYNVRVYAGADPVTGKDIYLSESTLDAGDVERIQTRLQAQVDKQRSAATRATLDYVIENWLEGHEGEETTLDSYRGYFDRSIRPKLGDVPVSELRTRTIEQFYNKLRKCSVICDGQPLVDHRTSRPHECRLVKHRRRPGRPAASDSVEHDCAAAGCTVIECKPHVCKPMGQSSVRQIHAIITGALDMAVRWEWISSNPAETAKKPKQKPPQPKPPTATEAARIADRAWEEDLAWGMLVWLVMVTGSRRGEALALRWSDLHLDGEGVAEFRRNYIQRRGKKFEKDTKTHQMRRNALDPDTLELLAIHRRAYEERMAQLGAPVNESAYVFSYEPDNSRPCNPDGVTHRYARMCKSLGIKSHLHTLRHYSATELISAGVDIRTVAGRLGHGGGGTTTLRVYAAWVPESDKRAAGLLASRMPRPGRRE